VPATAENIGFAQLKLLEQRPISYWVLSAFLLVPSTAATALLMLSATCVRLAHSEGRSEGDAASNRDSRVQQPAATESAAQSTAAVAAVDEAATEADDGFHVSSTPQTSTCQPLPATEEHSGEGG
jgi:hypothetical protein